MNNRVRWRHLVQTLGKVCDGEHHCALSDGPAWRALLSPGATGQRAFEAWLPYFNSQESLILEKNVNFTQLRCFKDVCTLVRL